MKLTNLTLIILYLIIYILCLLSVMILFTKNFVILAITVFLLILLFYFIIKRIFFPVEKLTYEELLKRFDSGVDQAVIDSYIENHNIKIIKGLHNPACTNSEK